MLELTVLNDLPVDMPVALRAQIKGALELAYEQGKTDGGRPMAMLMGLLDQDYSGEEVSLEDPEDGPRLVSVNCSLISQRNGVRRVEATLIWEDETDGPLQLEAALENSTPKQ